MKPIFLACFVLCSCNVALPVVTPGTPAAPPPAVAVDADRNGVRDDVDRLIATEFGSADLAAQRFATSLETAVTARTPTAISAHLDLVRCTFDLGRLEKLEKVTQLTVDSGVRRAAYRDAFAGAVLTKEGCP